MNKESKIATDQELEEKLKSLLERPKQFEPKPASCFRNNYKNFQYDYEEDFYEPDR